MRTDQKENLVEKLRSPYQQTKEHQWLKKFQQWYFGMIIVKKWLQYSEPLAYLSIYYPIIALAPLQP